jgi:hypothetical protein
LRKNEEKLRENEEQKKKKSKKHRENEITKRIEIEEKRRERDTLL